MGCAKSHQESVGAIPPDEKMSIANEDVEPIAAARSFLEAIGAEPLEPQPNSEIQEAQIMQQVPSKTGKMSTPSHIISRREKQRQQAFLDMCSSDSRILPYSAFQGHTERLKADTLQDIRHLALIDLKGCKHQQHSAERL